MVLTRNQIENLTREELIEELLKLSNINIQLTALSDRFGTFASKHEELKSDLFVTKKCNALLYYSIITKCCQQHPVSPERIPRS